MLVHMAISDAYGAAFEFIPPDQARDHGLVNDASGYGVNPETALGAGRYTDDTQMAIAIAELVLGGVDFGPVSVADAFVGGFQRDPRRGYSRRLQSALENAATGADLLNAITPNSTRSEAAMRAGPIAFLD